MLVLFVSDHKLYRLVVEGNQPMIRDRDAVRIPAQVLEHVDDLTKRLFGIDVCAGVV